MELHLATAAAPSEKPSPLPVRIAHGFVYVMIMAMILLAVGQVIVRKLGHEIPGVVSYVRQLTLWIGFVGALAAMVRHEHLSLSTVSLLPEKARPAASAIANAVVTAVCGLLTFASVQMVLSTRESLATFAGGIPTWWAELIVPVCFGLIALVSAARAPAGWSGRALAALAGLAMVSLHWVDAGATHLLWPGAILLIASFLLGTPVFVVIAGVTMLLYYATSPDSIVHSPVSGVPLNALELVNEDKLPAVPLLAVAGYVLAAGGASQRMVAAYRAVLGWMPAGLGLMVLFVCALFTAFNGGSGVTIIALGGVVYPLLREEKYPEGFSVGLVTAAGSLGLLFPPSLPVILYAVVAKIDPKTLFIAGLLPGFVVLAFVAAYVMLIGVKAKAPRHPFSWSEARRALWVAKWDIALPVVVIAAFMSGIATIVECAAVAAALALIIEVGIFGTLRPLRDLPRVLTGASSLIGAVVVLMALAYAFTQCLVLAGVPDGIVAWMQAHIHSKWVFLLALNVILLVLGSVLEIYSAIFVLAPLVAPLGVAYNVDPVHLGVVFLANLELGFLLPPMGLNLFLGATRFKKPLPKLYGWSAPFLVIMAAGVLVVTYVEGFTTVLLHLLHIQ